MGLRLQRAIDAFNDRFSDVAEDADLMPIWHEMLHEILQACREDQDAKHQADDRGI